jgi:hypothetical protein
MRLMRACGVFVVFGASLPAAAPSAQDRLTEVHRPLAAVERHFELRAIFQDPAIDGRVVDRHPELQALRVQKLE